MLWSQNRCHNNQTAPDSIAAIRAPGRVEPPGVTCKLGNHAAALRQALQQLFMETTVGGRKAIVMPEAILAGQHKPGLAEVGQMAGRAGLSHVEQTDQIANAQLPFAQQIQDPQPGSVGKCPKDRFDFGG